jgi:hypothetical protein
MKSPKGSIVIEISFGSVSQKSLSEIIFQTWVVLNLNQNTNSINRWSNQIAQVTAEANLGDWLNDEYGDRSKMKRVLERVVMNRPSKDPMPTCVSIEPVESLNECFVDITQLDYGRDAKHGCC